MTKIKTMVVSPGRKVTVLASKLQRQTQAVSQKLPLPIWLRPFAISFGVTALIVLTGAGTFALVNSVIRGVSSISLPTIPTIPSLPSLPNPLAQPVGDKTKNSSSDILSRRQQLEIPEGFFIQIVDSLFYTQKPELKGRSLTSKPEDAGLRDEWRTIAGDFLNKIEQANLSTASRQKLGTYTQKDYENWRRQASSGQLGNYTPNQLTKDTNEKFDQLFPLQQRGKLNQQTFGQIWYAIAADQVSKARGN